MYPLAYCIHMCGISCNYLFVCLCHSSIVMSPSRLKESNTNLLPDVSWNHCQNALFRSIMNLLYYGLTVSLIALAGFAHTNLSPVPYQIDVNDNDTDEITGTFSPDFVWSTASASYQVEGGWNTSCELL